jgi:hypothetical protein
MPRLVRMMILHGAIGLGLGAAFTALILWFDVAGLGGLVARSADGWLAAFLLTVFSGITFGGVQIGIAVMSMAEIPDDDPFGGGKRDALQADDLPHGLQTVPIPAADRPHR